jgi:peptide-methionine (R)-S-oxide reductase
MAYNQLTEQERYILLEKGTERAFSGAFWNHHDDGIYTCRQCNSPLFDSQSKFDSFTGWPSFDEEIGNSVKEVPDADGRRVEIVCANCGGHLGHVFKGEGMTSKSVRHCVNSASLQFVKRVHGDS